MGVLIGGFLLLFGLIFLAVGGIPMLISGGLSLDNPTEEIFAGIGAIIAFIGAISVLTGLANARKMRAKAMMIYEKGVETEGTVTYVDRNYSILVNNAPIYSIVEVKFQTIDGREQVSRKENIETELVIRNQIQVGSKVQMKYLSEDPTSTIFMFPDPKAAGA